MKGKVYRKSNVQMERISNWIAVSDIDVFINTKHGLGERSYL